MSEYTPKTHEIRAAAVIHRAPLVHRQMLGQTIRDAERVALTEFDRWLAEVVREASEEAWDEAVMKIYANAWVDLDPRARPIENPYRRNEGENE